MYCCDPVIGDDRDGVYVRPGIAEMLRDRMLPAADIATPNRFELDMLTGTACRTLAQAKAAVAQVAATLQPGGLRCVLLTSLRTEATPDDATDMLVAEAGRFHLLRTPLLPLDVNGAGDAIAALFLFHRLHSGSEVVALEAAGAAIHGLLRRTAAAGSHEILTVAAQEEFVAPGTALSRRALLSARRGRGWSSCRGRRTRNCARLCHDSTVCRRLTVAGPASRRARCPRRTVQGKLQRESASCSDWHCSSSSHR